MAIPSKSLLRRTRSMSFVNSISSRNGINKAGSSGRTFSSSISSSRGTSVRSDTSSLEMRACSANSMRFSRRLFCLISLARSSSVSRSPYSPISCAAVFTPIPGTPGTLSEESPASAWISITCSGPRPNFSTTSSRPILRFFIGSNIETRSPTSCIRSLSDDMITTSPPSASTLRA